MNSPWKFIGSTLSFYGKVIFNVVGVMLLTFLAYQTLGESLAFYLIYAGMLCHIAFNTFIPKKGEIE